jgi:hypothetical protein
MQKCDLYQRQSWTRRFAFPAMPSQTYLNAIARVSQQTLDSSKEKKGKRRKKKTLREK